MKKFVKYSLYGLIYAVIIFFLAVMFIVTAKADLTEPNKVIEPYQVVKIQLTGLMNNDAPNINSGIEQTWKFAHPTNKKYTGPLPKFISLLNSESYKMLLNHMESEIIEVFKSIPISNIYIILLFSIKCYILLQFNLEIQIYNVNY